MKSSKYLGMGVLASTLAVVAACGDDEPEARREPPEVVTLEALPVGVDGAWTGSDGSGKFVDGFATFRNVYDTEFGSWSGFAYSNQKDTTTSGFVSQLAAYPGAGAEGSRVYAVGYDASSSGFGDPAKLELDAPSELDGVYVANTTYAYLSMRDGDDFAKRFGGADGTDPDWFLLTIQGHDAAGAETGTVEVYLADYRAPEASGDTLLADWKWVELESLGEVSALTFALTSSDVGDFGMNTPAYFALDDLTR